MDLTRHASRTTGMTRSATLAVLLLLGVPAIAEAAGQPVLGTAPPSIPLRSGTHRYFARAYHHRTVLEDVTSAGTLSHTIDGSFAIPMITYAGALGGLSANGRTLVLVRPRTAFPQRRSQLAIIDADSLALLRDVRLRGDFAFDAVSPNGRWIYLIQYSPLDATSYRVRALDASTGRLLAHDIVDPHDRGEKMQGIPLTRMTTAGGRWAYTLYGLSGPPFIHALDTAHRQARCIDVVPFPKQVQPFSVRLRLTGHTLAVVTGRRTLEVLDTRTWRPIDQSVGRGAKASSSRADVGARASSGQADVSPAGADTLPLAAAFIGIGLAAAVMLRRRARAR